VLTITVPIKQRFHKPYDPILADQMDARNSDMQTPSFSQKRYDANFELIIACSISGSNV
jgi:hypothetical protein